jgi:hypothetical protein
VRNAAALGGVAISEPGPLVDSVITVNHASASAPYRLATAGDVGYSRNDQVDVAAGGAVVAEAGPQAGSALEANHIEKRGALVVELSESGGVVS